MAHIAIWITGLGLMTVFSLSASIALAKDPANSPATQPSPDPGLSPKAVVKIVANALAKNDGNDNGIKLAWKFASPGNQQATGPIERFIPMVKDAEYQPMLNAKSVAVQELARDDDSAAELVTVTDSTGNKAYYIFSMTRQHDGNLQNCWMTDGVIRVEPREQPQPRGLPADGPEPV
jgi:hypothetical protein